jgi:uncharacterized Zn finger protein
MSLVILCPKCQCRTEKMTVLSQVSRDGDPLYRCSSCGLICSAPQLEPVIGKPILGGVSTSGGS